MNGGEVVGDQRLKMRLAHVSFFDSRVLLILTSGRLIEVDVDALQL